MFRAQYVEGSLSVQSCDSRAALIGLDMLMYLSSSAEIRAPPRRCALSPTHPPT
jgi:hypothetical protein